MKTGAGGRFSTKRLTTCTAASDTAQMRKRSDLPDALLANRLGAGKGDPDGAAGKCGDAQAAFRYASRMITDEFIAAIAQTIGTGPAIIVGVTALEAGGLNAIPQAAANIIAAKLGLQADDELYQSNRPMRTQKGGLERIFHQPTFAGEVSPGARYFLLDDTLTQGATLANLAKYIRAKGGIVCGIAALDGKSYSVIIKPNPEIIAKLEEKFGEIQDHFERVFGYGFDQLTQSEARYLANFEPAELVRERILAQEPQRKWTPVPAAGNQEGSGRKEKKGLMPDFANAPAHRTPRNELGYTP